MTTISSNIQPPQPVTLCYKRVHKLLPHKHHHSHNNNNTDATPAASPRASPRALPPQQPLASHSTATLRLTPAAYPCPPQYRNKRRLPFVQQQWYTEQLRAEHRRHSAALTWEAGEVQEIRADWGWTVGRLTKRIGKADGVHVTRGGRRRSLGGEQGESMGGGEEKRVVDEVAGGEEQTGMWNTQSLLIRVDSAAGEERQSSEAKEREEEREDGESEERQLISATGSSRDSPIRPARAAFLSPTRQRKVSEEEEKESASQQPQQSTLTSSLLPSPSSSSSSTNSATPHFSFQSAHTANTSTAANHNTNTTHTDTPALEDAVLASFNPLPPPFIPSLTTTRDGSTSTRQVQGGESAVLSVLRDECLFGVSGVGVLCRLNVYGYVVWVKAEVDEPQWSTHLRSNGSLGR